MLKFKVCSTANTAFGGWAARAHRMGMRTMYRPLSKACDLYTVKLGDDNVEFAIYNARVGILEVTDPSPGELLILFRLVEVGILHTVEAL